MSKLSAAMLGARIGVAWAKYCDNERSEGVTEDRIQDFGAFAHDWCNARWWKREQAAQKAQRISMARYCKAKRGGRV